LTAFFGWLQQLSGVAEQQLFFWVEQQPERKRSDKVAAQRMGNTFFIRK